MSAPSEREVYEKWKYAVVWGKGYTGRLRFYVGQIDGDGCVGPFDTGEEADIVLAALKGSHTPEGASEPDAEPQCWCRNNGIRRLLGGCLRGLEGGGEPLARRLARCARQESGQAGVLTGSLVSYDCGFCDLGVRVPAGGSESLDDVLLGLEEDADEPGDPPEGWREGMHTAIRTIRSHLAGRGSAGEPIDWEVIAESMIGACPVPIPENLTTMWLDAVATAKRDSRAPGGAANPYRGLTGVETMVYWWETSIRPGLAEGVET